MGYGGKRVAGKTNVESVLGGVNEAVQGGVERRIVVILRRPVLRHDVSGLARRIDGEWKVVVDVRVHARQRELDARDADLIAAREDGLPATRARRAGERSMQTAEVKRREADIELRQPSRVVESSGGDAAFHRLGHLKVDPVEPLQSVGIGAVVSMVCMTASTPGID